LTRSIDVGRACKVCEHPQRRDIETWLAGGDALRQIGARTGLSKDALSRHKRDHSPMWLASLTASEPASGTVRERIEALIARIEAVMADAEVGRRHTVVLAAAKELRASLEVVGRITGELDERPTTVINLATSEEWLRTRTLIIGALRPHPEAAADVVAALAPFQEAS
jgi:hypothetical protein